VREISNAPPVILEIDEDARSDSNKPTHYVRVLVSLFPPEFIRGGTCPKSQSRRDLCAIMKERNLMGTR